MPFDGANNSNYRLTYVHLLMKQKFMGVNDYKIKELFWKIDYLKYNH